MKVIFEGFFYSAISSGLLILVVLLLRFKLRHISKKYTYFLWLLVLIKLFFPLSIEVVSESDALVNASNGVSAVEQYAEDSIGDFLPFFNNNSEERLEGGVIVDFPGRENGSALMIIWVLGILLFSLHSLVSYFFFISKLRNAKQWKGNVFIQTEVNTAFIVGLINPRIYLPEGLSDDEIKHVLDHEYAHLKRRDYLFKPLIFILCMINWFNPIVWIAYRLYVKDMEMSCDEIATTNYTERAKRAYAKTLLSISIRQSRLSVPLAFSENNTKSRVVNVLRFREKNRFLIPVIAIIATTSFALAILDFTPKTDYHQLYEHKIDNIAEGWNAFEIAEILFGDDFGISGTAFGPRGEGYVLNINFKNDIDKFSINETDFTNKVDMLFVLAKDLDVITFSYRKQHADPEQRYQTNYPELTRYRSDFIKRHQKDMAKEIRSLADFKEFYEGVSSTEASEMKKCMLVDFRLQLEAVETEEGFNIKWFFDRNDCSSKIKIAELHVIETLNYNSTGIYEPIITHNERIVPVELGEYSFVQLKEESGLDNHNFEVGKEYSIFFEYEVDDTYYSKRIKHVFGNK